MKYLLSGFMLFLTLMMSAQNSSFGIGIAALDYEGEFGLQYSANIRTQFTNTFGWSTEVGYGRFNEEESRGFIAQTLNEIGLPITIEETTTNRRTQYSLKTGVTVKLLSKYGLNLEAIASGGFVNGNSGLYGLLSGELFLSTQLTNNIVAGIPVGYNYVTWERNQFYTTGISIRYHM